MTGPFSTHEVFNQPPPLEDVNLFTSDAALAEAMAREGAGQATASLKAFGRIAGSAEAFERGRLANENPPRLETHDRHGRRRDTVAFHPAYHALMTTSCEQGLHSSAWSHIGEGRTQPRPGAHVARAGAFYMAAQMEAGHCCPITMTSAAVPVLLQQPEIAEEWIERILPRRYDPRFVPAGEKIGRHARHGHDREAGRHRRARIDHDGRADRRRRSRGEYVITGHKWFMSAPMSDAFLVLAQAPGGLTCFLMPRFLPDGTVNALRFQRLKDKLGNRSNASSEVEFHGAWARAIGEEGRGIPTIIEMVTHTRLDCALASAGLMRLALANAIHHAEHRLVFQKKLADQPLMEQVLADLALDVEAATVLSFRLARSFDRATDARASAWRRLMTPITKYWVCKIAPALVAEAMECMGGSGYVEEAPLARIYREVPVNAIWEGSGNVMALDVMRVLQREPEALEAVMEELRLASADDARLRAAHERVRGPVARAQAARRARAHADRGAGDAVGCGDPQGARAGCGCRRVHRDAAERRAAADLRPGPGARRHPRHRRARLAEP